jgi:hypothetical protein
MADPALLFLIVGAIELHACDIALADLGKRASDTVALELTA